MLPKEQKLPRIQFAAKGYRALRTPCFIVKTKPNGLPRHRIGIVISTGAIKGSVKRNFWKRRFKNVLKKTAGTPSDILVIVNAKIKELTTRQFYEELKGIHL